jgi:hypothetical protein
MPETTRTFADIRAPRTVEPPQAIEAYLADLDALIERHHYFRQDRVIPAIGAGAASGMARSEIETCLSPNNRGG